MSLEPAVFCAGCEEFAVVSEEWKECPNCNGHIDSDDVCCQGCGRCAECGAMADEFCDECGYCISCCDCDEDEDEDEDEVAE